MKIFDILSKMCYIKKNTGSIENLNDGFLIAILPNILEKNEIRLTVYELKTEMWKKKFTSKWNNNGKNVKSYFKWS